MIIDYKLLESRYWIPISRKIPGRLHVLDKYIDLMKVAAHIHGMLPNIYFFGIKKALTSYSTFEFQNTSLS